MKAKIKKLLILLLTGLLYVFLAVATFPADLRRGVGR